MKTSNVLRRERENNSGVMHTLDLIQIVVFFFGEQMRMGIFPGVDLSDKQRLEPAVLES